AAAPSAAASAALSLNSGADALAEPAEPATSTPQSADLPRCASDSESSASDPLERVPKQHLYTGLRTGGVSYHLPWVATRSLLVWSLQLGCMLYIGIRNLSSESSAQYFLDCMWRYEQFDASDLLPLLQPAFDLYDSSFQAGTVVYMVGVALLFVPLML